jgi:hypothetical protein
VLQSSPPGRVAQHELLRPLKTPRSSRKLSSWRWSRQSQSPSLSPLCRSFLQCRSGRHPATDACPPFPLSTVVLHDNRSTANRRLELTARYISRDANSNWPCTAAVVRFRSSQRRRARLTSPPATGQWCHLNNSACDWLCGRNLPTTASFTNRK